MLYYGNTFLTMVTVLVTVKPIQLQRFSTRPDMKYNLVDTPCPWLTKNLVKLGEKWDLKLYTYKVVTECLVTFKTIVFEFSVPEYPQIQLDNVILWKYLLDHGHSLGYCKANIIIVIWIMIDKMSILQSKSACSLKILESPSQHRFIQSQSKAMEI
eukprot:403365431